MLRHFVLHVVIGTAYLCESQPNFVVIFADDFGWGDAGINDPSAETPNIDLLGSTGIIFSDMHAGASVCTPSRSSLLTGRYGARTGVYQNFATDSLYGLPLGEHTIAQLLEPAGYDTAMIGKWHLGALPPYHPTFRGFQRYFGLPYSPDMVRGALCHSGLLKCRPMEAPCPKDPSAAERFADPAFEHPADGPDVLLSDGESHGERPGLHPAMDDVAFRRAAGGGTYSTRSHTRTRSMAVAPDANATDPALPLFNGTTNCSGAPTCNTDILEQPANITTLSARYGVYGRNYILEHAKGSGAKPFFLYVALMHTHVPLAHEPRWNNASKANTVFADTVLEMDDTIRMIWEALTEAGIQNDTLVLATADNGPWRVKCDLAGSQGPFKGTYQQQLGGGSTGKFTTWEGGHREFGIASWPGRITPGQRSNATVSTLDFLPTILSVAGVPLPTDRVFDGYDLSPILFEGATSVRDILFHPDGSGNLTAIRYKNYKAFWSTYSNVDCAGVTGRTVQHNPPIVFDLDADPAESTPIQPGKAVMDAIEAARVAVEASVKNTYHNKANYAGGGQKAWACCNPQHVVCRCED